MVSSNPGLMMEMDMECYGESLRFKV